jgi:dihydroneopterin aldolase
VNDIIFIDNLPVETLIGVYEEERLSPQTLLISVELCRDLRPAAKSDDLQDTLDYQVIADLVTTLCQRTEYKLLESLAELLAGELLSTFECSGVRIRINKPSALPQSDAVGICIERGTFQ